MDFLRLFLYSRKAMLFLENLSPEEKQQSLENLEKVGLPSRRYYILTTLAIIIATFGLILNNPAIVIGAMLVAPLMLPILLLSMAIVTGRIRLIFKTLETITKSTILSVVIATFISLFIPIFEIPSEVIIRSQPAILDMFIALAAGAAAMYAMIKKDSASLPGVAISVSLMPPLSALGIGLATRNLGVAYGAGLLFITNLVAIIFSGAIILLLFRFKPYAKTKEGVLKQGAFINIILILVLSVILSSSFIKVSEQERQKISIKDELTRQLKALGKGDLESFSVESKKEELRIMARVLSPSTLTAQDMEVLTNALAFRLEESVNLQVMVIPIAMGGKVLPPEEIEKIKQEKILNPYLGNKAPLATLSAEPYMAPMEPIPEEPQNTLPEYFEASPAAVSINEASSAASPQRVIIETYEEEK